MFDLANFLYSDHSRSDTNEYEYREASLWFVRERLGGRSQFCASVCVCICNHFLAGSLTFERLNVEKRSWAQMKA